MEYIASSHKKDKKAVLTTSTMPTSLTRSLKINYLKHGYFYLYVILALTIYPKYNLATMYRA